MRRIVASAIAGLGLVASLAGAQEDVVILRAGELSQIHEELEAGLVAAASTAREEYVTGAIGADSPLPESGDRNHFLNIVHRRGYSWAESHDTLTDFYVVVEGSGTLLLGGTMVDEIEIEDRPGERRSPSLEGATAHELGEGDLIDIPPGVAHQWDLEDDESVTYVIVKVRQESP